jgi:hypothetical protein
VPKRSNPTQLLLTGLIGFGVQRSADSSGLAQRPEQTPMQPGSSNTPQFRKIESQQDRKKQATPTKNPNRKKECQKEATLPSCC